MIRITEHACDSFHFAGTPWAAEALGILPVSHRTLKVPSTLIVRAIFTGPVLMIHPTSVVAAWGIFSAITQAYVCDCVWTDGVLLDLDRISMKK
jgi:hypothetical protein